MSHLGGNLDDEMLMTVPADTKHRLAFVVSRGFSHEKVAVVSQKSHNFLARQHTVEPFLLVKRSIRRNCHLRTEKCLQTISHPHSGSQRGSRALLPRFTKLQKLAFSFSFAFGAKFLSGAKNSENARELDFFSVSLWSDSFSTRLQVLFDFFFLGGAFGGELSKPLSATDDEHELNSMSVAIRSRVKTEKLIFFLLLFASKTFASVWRKILRRKISGNFQHESKLEMFTEIEVVLKKYFGHV